MVAFRPETNPDQFRLVGVEKSLALIGLQTALGIKSGDTKPTKTSDKKTSITQQVYEAIAGWEPMATKPKHGYTTQLEPGWLPVESAPVVAEAIQQGIDHVAQNLRPLQEEYPAIGRAALQSLASLMQSENSTG